MNKCPVPGCTQSRKADQVMCREHWLRVPTDLRSRIRNSYRYRTRRWTYRKEHLALISEAIKGVRDQESGPKDEYGPGEFRINCERCGADIAEATRRCSR